MKIIVTGGHFLKLTSTAIITFLFLLSAGVGSAEILYVEPGSSIQAVVNNSTSGDFIIVKPGEYRENVVVNISGLNVSSESGNPDGVLIRALDQNSSVFHLTADNITIQGFSIKGAEEVFNVSENTSTTENLNSENSSNETNESEIYNPESDSVGFSWDEVGCLSAGICLELANNCTIEKNNLSDIQYGIYLQNSMNTTLSENNFSRNSIWLDEWCTQNLLINNTIEGSSLILGANCWNNTISQNKLFNGQGISIACCGGNNVVSLNDIMNCSTGIDVYDVQAKTVFKDNRIVDCEYGIYLSFIFGSEVYNNTISNSSTGIFLREDCHTNEVSNNTITASRESGLYLLDQSSENRIFNNYFNNSVNVKLENIEGNNTWNSTRMPGNNIVGGPYLGGNFWADLNGSGYSQLSNDSDSDGICDDPYTINGTDVDYLPLSRPPMFKKWL